jgi:ketosteroid isomerase-like protein
MSSTERQDTNAVSQATADVVTRFISAFKMKDESAITDLVAPDCVMEAMQPAPDGQRVEGYDANVAFWKAMVADPNGTFEVENVEIHGQRAINHAKTNPVADLGQAGDADASQH